MSLRPLTPAILSQFDSLRRIHRAVPDPSLFNKIKSKLQCFTLPSKIDVLSASSFFTPESFQATNLETMNSLQLPQLSFWDTTSLLQFLIEFKSADTELAQDAAASLVSMLPRLSARQLARALVLCTQVKAGSAVVSASVPMLREVAAHLDANDIVQVVDLFARRPPDFTVANEKESETHQHRAEMWDTLTAAVERRLNEIPLVKIHELTLTILFSRWVYHTDLQRLLINKLSEPLVIAQLDVTQLSELVRGLRVKRIDHPIFYETIKQRGGNLISESGLDSVSSSEAIRIVVAFGKFKLKLAKLREQEQQLSFSSSWGADAGISAENTQQLLAAHEKDLQQQLDICMAAIRIMEAPMILEALTALVEHNVTDTSIVVGLCVRLRALQNAWTVPLVAGYLSRLTMIYNAQKTAEQEDTRRLYYARSDSTWSQQRAEQPSVSSQLPLSSAPSSDPLSDSTTAAPENPTSRTCQAEIQLTFDFLRSWIGNRLTQTPMVPSATSVNGDLSSAAGGEQAGAADKTGAMNGSPQESETASLASNLTPYAHSSTLFTIAQVLLMRYGGSLQTQKARVRDKVNDNGVGEYANEARSSSDASIEKRLVLEYLFRRNIWSLTDAVAAQYFTDAGRLATVSRDEAAALISPIFIVCPNAAIAGDIDQKIHDVEVTGTAEQDSAQHHSKKQDDDNSEMIVVARNFKKFQAALQRPWKPQSLYRFLIGLLRYRLQLVASDNGVTSGTHRIHSLLSAYFDSQSSTLQASPVLQEKDLTQKEQERQKIHQRHRQIHLIVQQQAESVRLVCTHVMTMPEWTTEATVSLVTLLLKASAGWAHFVDEITQNHKHFGKPSFRGTAVTAEERVVRDVVPFHTHRSLKLPAAIVEKFGTVLLQLLSSWAPKMSATEASECLVLLAYIGVKDRMIFDSIAQDVLKRCSSNITGTGGGSTHSHTNSTTTSAWQRQRVEAVIAQQQQRRLHPASASSSATDYGGDDHTPLPQSHRQQHPQQVVVTNVTVNVLQAFAIAEISVATIQQQCLPRLRLLTKTMLPRQIALALFSLFTLKIPLHDSLCTALLEQAQNCMVMPSSYTFVSNSNASSTAVPAAMKSIRCEAGVLMTLPALHMILLYLRRMDVRAALVSPVATTIAQWLKRILPSLLLSPPSSATTEISIGDVTTFVDTLGHLCHFEASVVPHPVIRKILSVMVKQHESQQQEQKDRKHQKGHAANSHGVVTRDADDITRASHPSTNDYTMHMTQPAVLTLLHVIISCQFPAQSSDVTCIAARLCMCEAENRMLSAMGHHKDIIHTNRTTAAVNVEQDTSGSNDAPTSSCSVSAHQSPRFIDTVSSDALVQAVSALATIGYDFNGALSTSSLRSEDIDIRQDTMLGRLFKEGLWSDDSKATEMLRTAGLLKLFIRAANKMTQEKHAKAVAAAAAIEAEALERRGHTGSIQEADDEEFPDSADDDDVQRIGMEAPTLSSTQRVTQKRSPRSQAAPQSVKAIAAKSRPNKIDKSREKPKLASASKKRSKITSPAALETQKQRPKK